MHNATSVPREHAGAMHAEATTPDPVDLSGIGKAVESDTVDHVEAERRRQSAALLRSEALAIAERLTGEDRERFLATLEAHGPGVALRTPAARRVIEDGQP